MKRMKKVDIIARAEQLEDLKEALNRIGIQALVLTTFGDTEKSAALNELAKSVLI